MRRAWLRVHYFGLTLFLGYAALKEALDKVKEVADFVVSFLHKIHAKKRAGNII